MILLDTNVLSELMRPVPAGAVETWMSAQPAAGMFISAITEAELRYGLALLPEGQRHRHLLAQVEVMLAEDFAGRILPFDSAAAAAPSPRRMPRSLRSPPLVVPYWPPGT